MTSRLDKSVVSTSFIGRGLQLAALDQWLLQGSQGRCQVVLVAGEAGIGKSRLMAETRRHAHQQGWYTEQGSCFESDLIFPYAPVIDLLRHCLAARASGEVAVLLTPLAAELVKLLPELAFVLPDLTPTPPFDPEAEKRRLFETLTQFFSRLPAPLLLIIEDLHWSDDTSLEFLRYLARRLANHPLLLLLTYRSDEVHPALQHFLAALDREQRPAELVIPRFTMPEVDALLRAIFEQERPVRAEFLDALYDLTAGNPFFIEEVLKALIAAGELFYRDGAWDRKPINELHIPRSVQDAVQRRVMQLSEEARHSLTLAAVAGQQFDFGVLQAVTQGTEAELLAQIKELLAAQLVVEVSAERFAFRHALTRQAVYSQLLVRERQLLHQQIGQILERDSADAVEDHQSDASTRSTASLAYHFYEAGDWERTLTYASHAAEQAHSLDTPRAAIEQYSRALEAAQHLAQTTLLTDLHRARGLVYETIGEFELALADLEAVRQLAHTTEDRPLAWRALLDLGKLWASRDYAQTGAYFQRALELARALDDPTALARTLNWVANWHLNTEQPQEALHYHREALEILEALNDRRALAQAFDHLGMASCLAGAPVASAEYLQQAVALWEALDEQQGLASTLGILPLCGVSYFTDTLVPAPLSAAACSDWHERALQITRKIGWRTGEAYVLALFGHSLGSRAEYGRALEMARWSIEVAQEIEHRQWISLALRESGTLYLDLLALPTARQQFEQALVLANEIGSLFHARMATGFLIGVLILQDELVEAEALLETAFSPELPMQTMAQRLIWRRHAELALAQGDSALALQIVDQLFASAANTEDGNIGAIPLLALLRGEALIAHQRWTEAESTLVAACATAQVRNSQRLVWRIQAAMAKLYRAQARHAEAEQAFTAARTIIAEIAATLPDPALRDNFEQKANAMLPQLKATTPLQAARQAHGGLTRREWEIALLVAEGKSNREIAESLVVGIRTVEGHIGRILSKLAFTSRTQIATWVVKNKLG
jgi:DNA-binding NarL/FixJ family response regulator